MSRHLRRASLSLVDRPDYFRLVKILPGRLTDTLRCSLSVHEISNSAGTYKTGSYVWGPKTDCRVIYVDDEPVTIRQRLWNFLRHLRRSDIQVVVWIDALCIKQDDPKEKSQQIQLLSKMFEHAAESISWLGPADEEIHRAFDIIEQRASDTRDFYRAANCPRNSLTKHGWNCIIKLLEHEYFTRRWIVQEVMLPVRLILQCGHRTLPLTALESFLSTFDRWESPERCLQVDQSIVRRLWSDRAKLHIHHGALRLPDLLLRYKDTTCKNPCDKVNAFLGMLDDGHSLYCEDDLKVLYDRVLTYSKRQGPELIAFGLFMEQELGLRLQTCPQAILVKEDRSLSMCKAF